METFDMCLLTLQGKALLGSQFVLAWGQRISIFGSLDQTTVIRNGGLLSWVKNLHWMLYTFILGTYFFYLEGLLSELTVPYITGPVHYIHVLVIYYILSHARGMGSLSIHHMLHPFVGGFTGDSTRLARVNIHRALFCFLL